MSKREVKLDVFVGADGQHYWSLIAPNGQVIAVAGEGFTRRSSAFRNFKKVAKYIATLA